MERVAIGSGAAGLLVASAAKLAANPLGPFFSEKAKGVAAYSAAR